MDTSFKNYKISFGAGVTPLIKQEIRVINPIEIERTIKKQFGTDCDFKDNKTLAAGTYYALNILKSAAKKFGLPFDAVPPSIRVYNPMELVRHEDVKFGFCTAQKEKVMKKNPEFEPRSIFIKNISDNIDSWNAKVESWYDKHIVSSDHFLAPFLHELLHNIHLNLLFERSPKYGLTNAIYMANTSFSYQQNRVIADKIGTYARTSKMELFPEVLAKNIAESLDITGKEVVSNPLSKLKEMPKYVREFIEDQL